MKALHSYAFSIVPMFLGMVICFGHYDLIEAGNTVTIQGSYHRLSHDKEVRMNFTTAVGSMTISTSSGTQKSIVINPQPIKDSSNSAVVWWFSEPFQLSVGDTFAMQLQVSGDYYAKNPKFPKVANGSKLFVSAHLMYDAKNQKENSPVCSSLFPPSSFFNSTSLGRCVFDFKNEEPTIFDEKKNISFECSKNNAHLAGKQVRVRLTIISTEVKAADLNVTNVNPYNAHKDFLPDMK